jgi:hypothetical protein
MIYENRKERYWKARSLLILYGDIEMTQREADFLVQIVNPAYLLYF